jgi:two-component system, sensor histidine kinase and response regulator
MTTPVETTLTGSYDPLIVALSVVIAVAASYAALDLAGRVAASKGWAFAAWLVSGSVAMGVGIWSMHFTAMLAFRLPVAVSYDWPRVLQSFFVAILASTLALYVVSREKMTNASAIASGVLMGSGISALHYMDMLAMRMRADCHFNFILVALSVVFAITFSYSALRLGSHFRDVSVEAWRKIGSASFMGAGICAMHYTGMAAATFVATGVEPDLTHSVMVSVLGTSAFIIVSLLVLGFAMLSSLVDRRFQAQAFELALARANMELVRVGRASSLGELAASIAHEINQPLGAVVNSANAALRWMASQPPNLEEVREATTLTAREANRASEVIAKIRALLKEEPARMERVDLNEVIREALALAGSDIAKGRTAVKTELSADAATVSGDRVQLQQVMLNLISNAIEAMQALQDRPRKLRIKSATDSKAVNVSVEDTGVGLSQEDPERIFHPFFTTKRDGIGMGLSLSRSIIEAHRGRLWVEPRSPHGAVFQFSVPKSDGAE